MNLGWMLWISLSILMLLKIFQKNNMGISENQIQDVPDLMLQKSNTDLWWQGGR